MQSVAKGLPVLCNKN